MMLSDAQTWCERVCVRACVHARRPQHTDGRLIKRLIRARALGSEMRLRLFGKNCSTRHKGKKNWTGRGASERERRKRRERERERHQPGMCQKAVLWRPLLLLLPPSRPSCSLTLPASALACPRACMCVAQSASNKKETHIWGDSCKKKQKKNLVVRPRGRAGWRPSGQI